MYPDEVITTLQNKGFRVTLVGTRIFVSLKNRDVTTMEVALAINFEPDNVCRREHAIEVLLD